MKTRFAKPFESVQIKIPYEEGMNPYSGLTDFFEAQGVITKTGNKLEYISKETGEVFKEFRKGWERNENGCLDVVMAEFEMFETMAKLADSDIDDVAEGQNDSAEVNTAEDTTEE